jgi:hypothetical protein
MTGISVPFPWMKLEMEPVGYGRKWKISTMESTSTN